MENMPNRWIETTLGEVCEIIGGGTPRTTIAEYWNGDIPWLSVVDFNNSYRTVYETEKSITLQGLENSSTKLLEKNDIIISARGTVGALAQLGKQMAFNQSCYGLRANEMTSNDFLYYLISFHIKSLQSNTHGSVFDTITRETFNQILVLLPPLTEQKVIAKILSSLDDKIELNNKINKNLEEQAQAIFKSWFVDFEPFKEGEFIDSELGKIPKGWRVGTLDEIGSIIGGSTPSKVVAEYYQEDGIPWITPKDLSKNKNKFISRGDINISEKGYQSCSTKKIPAYSILFSSRAPIGYIAICKNEVTTNQGFKSIVPHLIEYMPYIYFLLKYETERIENIASGSTFKEVSGTMMKSLKIPIPHDKIIFRYQVLTSSIFINQERIEQENQTLATLRETLLPKLMSGEMRVSLETVEEQDT